MYQTKVLLREQIKNDIGGAKQNHIQLISCFKRIIYLTPDWQTFPIRIWDVEWTSSTDECFWLSTSVSCESTSVSSLALLLPPHFLCVRQSHSSDFLKRTLFLTRRSPDCIKSDLFVDSDTNCSFAQDLSVFPYGWKQIVSPELSGSINSLLHS